MILYTLGLNLECDDPIETKEVHDPLYRPDAPVDISLERGRNFNDSLGGRLDDRLPERERSR